MKTELNKRDENMNAEVGIEQAEFCKCDQNKKAELCKTDTNEEHDKCNDIGAFYLKNADVEKHDII